MVKDLLIITGGKGMLGKTLVDYFSKKKSYAVISVDLSKEKSTNNKLYFQADITSEIDVKNLFLKVKNLMSENSKLSLINCAGISVFEDFEERTKNSFMKVLEVNLYGTFSMIQQTTKLIKSLKTFGSIVNTGSIFAARSPDERNYLDLNRKNSEVYGASKAGVEQMTRYFAAHLAKYSIRVNCVSPGGILNEQNPQGPKFQKLYNYRVPMRRMALNKEMIGAYEYFLDDDKSHYVTGQTITVDGGYSSW